MMVFSLLVCLAQQAQQVDTGPDVVKATYKVRGTVVAFETGDYIHVVLRVKSKERSYFLKGRGMEYYLATHAGKPGVFTVQKIDSYIENAGARMVIDMVTDAKIGKQSYPAWWKAQTKAASEEELDNKFQPLVEKLSRTP